MEQESASDLERRLALAQRELSAAREQQAATAEVLDLIANSDFSGNAGQGGTHLRRRIRHRLPL
jgi:hypothetical protein